MEVTPTDLRQLLQRLRDGDADALRKFVDHCDTVIRIAGTRQRFRLLRYGLEAADLTQEVWLAFLRRRPDLGTGEDSQLLIDCLCRLTCNVARSLYDFQRAGKRDRRREVPLDSLT